MKEEIVSFIEKVLGFYIGQDKEEKVLAIISKRMQQLKIDSPDSYLKLIGSEDGVHELNNIIALVTVGETHFFRHKNQWKAFKYFALPKILSAKADNQRVLKIWSLGCSTGEEAYTIAICLWETLPSIAWDIKLLATDINPESIKKAKQGVYTSNSFRGVEQELIDKYFEKQKGGAYRIKKVIHDMVEFRSLNIISDKDLILDRDFDFIFCRNMLMYFRSEICADVINFFSQVIHKDGFLFIGHAEGLLFKDTVFRPIIYDDAFLYQKIDGPPNIQYKKSLPRKIQSKPVQVILNERVKNKQPVSLIRKANIKKNSKQDDTSSFFDQYNRILDLYYKEKFSVAFNEISTLYAINGENLNKLILKGLICINMSDLDQAEICYNQAFAMSDISPEVHMLGALIKEEKQDYKGAISINQAVIFLDKHFFTPYFRLGHIYYSTGEKQRSRRCFANAFKVLKSDNKERVRLFCGGISETVLEQVCKKRSKQ